MLTHANKHRESNDFLALISQELKQSCFHRYAEWARNKKAPSNEGALSSLSQDKKTAFTRLCERSAIAACKLHLCQSFTPKQGEYPNNCAGVHHDSFKSFLTTSDEMDLIVNKRIYTFHGPLVWACDAPLLLAQIVNGKVQQVSSVLREARNKIQTWNFM